MFCVCVHCVCVFVCVKVRESGERESEKRVREEKCESEIMRVCKFASVCVCVSVCHVYMFAKQLQNSKRTNFKGEFNSILFVLGEEQKQKQTTESLSLFR